MVTPLRNCAFISSAHSTVPVFTQYPAELNNLTADSFIFACFHFDRRTKRLHQQPSAMQLPDSFILIVRGNDVVARLSHRSKAASSSSFTGARNALIPLLTTSYIAEVGAPNRQVIRPVAVAVPMPLLIAPNIKRPCNGWQSANRKLHSIQIRSVSVKALHLFADTAPKERMIFFLSPWRRFIGELTR